jgi:hypothetical protein
MLNHSENTLYIGNQEWHPICTRTGSRIFCIEMTLTIVDKIDGTKEKS